MDDGGAVIFVKHRSALISIQTQHAQHHQGQEVSSIKLSMREHIWRGYPTSFDRVFPPRTAPSTKARQISAASLAVAATVAALSMHAAEE